MIPLKTRAVIQVGTMNLYSSDFAIYPGISRPLISVNSEQKLMSLLSCSKNICEVY